MKTIVKPQMKGTGSAKIRPASSVKYAVSLYGIRTDIFSEDDGKTVGVAGLTFGPATGASYVDTYVSHTPTGVTADGHKHRCIHDDDWETIAYWSQEDPYVYEQCYGNADAPSCTKAVPLYLKEPLMGKCFLGMEGDGAGILCGSINKYYRKWNNENSTYFNAESDEYEDGTNQGGWPDSKIRNTLNGTLTDNMLNITNKGTSFETDHLTEQNALISCFPEELQSAIVPRAVKSDTIYDDVVGNNVITYDKLWLFSRIENSGIPIRPNEGSQYPRQFERSIIDFGYARVITSCDYAKNEGYFEGGVGCSRWLRSLYPTNMCGVYCVDSTGIGEYGDTVCSTRYGFSPGFSLR